MRSIVRNLAVEMALQQRATGRRIAQLRERARLTQEGAADRAGVTLRAYQKWEAGGGIQYANLQKLAEALGVSMDEITGEQETPDPFRTTGQLDRIEAKVDANNAMLEKILILVTRIAAEDVPLPEGELGRVLRGEMPIPEAEPASSRRTAAGSRSGSA